MTSAQMANAALAFLATYLVHSTLLLGSAWVLGKYAVRTDEWRETLWKAALLGSVLTSALAQASPWTMARVSLPALASVEVLDGPVEENALDASSQTAATNESAANEAVANESLTHQSAANQSAANESAANESADPARTVTGTSPATMDAAALRVDAAPPESPSDEDHATLTLPVRSSSSAVAASARPDWRALLFAVWMALAALLVLRYCWRRVRLARVLRDRAIVTEADLQQTLALLRRTAGVWMPVRLTSSSAIATPLVLGRDEICVPERFVTELGADEQRAALAHELGHLARRDPAWLFGAMLLECVFFFQPMQRVARAGLREAAEYLADAWAVRVAGERLSLARCLAEVAAWVSTSDASVRAEAIAMAEGGSPLLKRVSRLLEREPLREGHALPRMAAAIALIAVAGAFAPAVGGARASDGAPEVDGAPELRSERADGTSPENASSPQQRIDVTRWNGQGSLADGLSWAATTARADGAELYWVGWASESRIARWDHTSSDSEAEVWSDFDEPGIGTELGVGTELRGAGDFQDAVVLVRMAADGADARVQRLAMRSANASMNLRGRVYWLGRQTPASSVAWLRTLYGDTNDPRMREAAIETIAVHAAPDVASFLRDVVNAREGRTLMEEAVEALAWHPTEETADFLFATARSDVDQMVRAEAAETLGELDHAAAGSALQSLVRTGAPSVREEALESLAERGDSALAALLLDIALNDPDEQMRREAVDLIEELPTSEAVPLLRRLLAESRDETVVHEAIEQLGEIGTAEAFEAIEAIAQDRTSPARREALEVLIDERDGPVDGQLLLELALHDDERDIRHDAVERMEELPAAEAVELLRRVAFESGDESAERQAAETLGEIGTMAALEVLDEIIERNPGEEASFQAVESIAENFARELVLPRLTKIAREHPSRRVRREALDQLADIGGGS